jgi:hypothetical protein
MAQRQFAAFDGYICGAFQAQQRARSSSWKPGIAVWAGELARDHGVPLSCFTRRFPRRTSAPVLTPPDSMGAKGLRLGRLRSIRS